MSNGIYVALSGAVAQEQSLDTTAQNLANASLPGYQRTRAVFAEVLRGQATASAGVATPARYAQMSQTSLDMSPGAIAVTNRSLDGVLPAGNYLAVNTPQGERYTRAVHLDIGPGGSLRSGALPVLGENGRPINAAPEGGAVTLSADGDVMQDGASVGRLKVVSFKDARSLAREGGTVLAATAASGAPITQPSSLQVGAVEQSNTETVSAMTDLVSANRVFEAFQRAIDTFRDADKRLVSTVPGA